MEIISNTKTELNTVEVQFNIDGDNFEKAIQMAFLKKKKNISIPGFRKGKATRKMIESTYGEGVFYEEAVNELYRTWIPKVVDELGLQIVDSPTVEVTELTRIDGVTFKTTFTVKPEVTIEDYKGVEVEIESKEVTEEDIDKEMEKLIADNARIIDSSDTPVKNGDIIKFDFTGFCEDEAFDGGTATDFELEIGSGKFIPGFEEQIVGKNIGEDFDVNVVFPEEYPSESLKGKPALFKCRINEKSSKELAELDDEFVKDISEFDTIAELREDVREKLVESNKEISDMELEREVAEKIIGLIQAEIPPVMFEDRVDEVARDWAFKYNMSTDNFARYSGMSTEQYRDGFREIAEKQVKFRLALERIAELEEIAVSEEEVQAEYDKIAKENRMSDEKVREIVTAASLESDLKADKALDLIKESAKITYKVPEEKPE
ncbi:MAG: trigger factor [Oscillospiraceae bacterium]|nr:trigger factor [Oscillospiraceae bacterium]